MWKTNVSMLSRAKVRMVLMAIDNLCGLIALSYGSRREERINFDSREGDRRE